MMRFLLPAAGPSLCSRSARLGRTAALVGLGLAPSGCVDPTPQPGNGEASTGGASSTSAPADTSGDETGVVSSSGVVSTTAGPSTGVLDGTEDGTEDGGGSGDTSTGEPVPTDCTAPQPIPPAPVDCTGVDGVLRTSVIIEPGGDPPSVLEGIRRVEGSVRINRIDATSLDFMACLQEVTGDVTIFGNEQLTDVSGLWSLTSIGTDFIFSDHSAPLDFDGLPNLVVLPGNLIIQDNEGLLAITGFHSLTEVGANLLIQNNDAMLHIDGLGGLMVMGLVFAVTANPQLCISSINCVGSGIVDPAVPPESWSTQANDNGC